MVMKKLIPKRAKELAKRYLFRIPPNLSRNYIQIDEDAIDAIKQSIKHNYHTGWRSEKYYTKAMYEKDLTDHLFGRLEKDRLRIVPWLDNARRIKASAILEIGCGTGPSSVALAEQGATVTGIDIDGGALNVAKDRCRIYGCRIRSCCPAWSSPDWC